MTIHNFKDLDAWKEGHKLVLEIYESTKTFPKDEVFGLTNQIRRAVVSVTSNIAEGFSRQSYKEKSQFYSMALGSLAEVQNQLIIAKDVNYIDETKYLPLEELAIKTHKIINGLIKGCKTYICSPNS